MITPEELYKHHIEAFPNDKCVTMFGYKADQILFALRQTYSKDKSQMTREEAFEKAKSIGNNSPWYEDTVRLLEALGLIKFEEKSSTIVKFDTDDYPSGLSVIVNGKLQFASKGK